MSRESNDSGPAKVASQAPTVGDRSYFRHRLTGFSPEAFEEVIQGGWFHHSVLNTRSLDATLERVVGEAVMLDRGHYGFSTIVEGDFNPDLLCFGLVNSPEKPARINGRQISADDLQCYARGAEMLYAAGVDTQWVGIQVDPNALAAIGASLDGVASPFANLSLTPDEALQLRRCVQSLMDDARCGHLTAAGEHALMTTLAECLTRDHDLEAETRHRCDLVQRATALFRADVHRPYDSESICALMGISERVLQLSFRQCLGVSPSRWNMALRLNLARRALLRRGGRNLSVTHVAAQFGFDHLGRFAEQYGKHFGESPSLTLRRPVNNQPPSP